MNVKVYKINGKKCIKRFLTIQDAKVWCWLHVEKYRIEVDFGNGDIRNIYA